MSKEKEEAERIVEMYDKVINSITLKPIKAASIIHVNGIISALVGLAPIEYWTNVKQEIEKL